MATSVTVTGTILNEVYERQYFVQSYDLNTSVVIQSWSCTVPNTSQVLAAIGVVIVPITSPTSSYYSSAGVYSYTVPAGTTAVSLTMIGGGGAGAGNYTTPQGWPSPGGGSAAYFNNVIVPVTPGSVIPITVGGAGADSVFGSLIAGAGGAGPDRAAANACQGGAAGIATGTGGVNGTVGGAGVCGGGNGYGANSPYGTGGVGVSSGNGGNATGFGAGGGGGGNNSSGGSGSPGFVSVRPVTASYNAYSLIFSGAHYGVFNKKQWVYKTTKYDSSLVYETDWSKVPVQFYSAVAYVPDPTPTTSVTWTVNTDAGTLVFTQVINNHWSYERDQLLSGFIRRGSFLDYSTSKSVYGQTQLNDLPGLTSLTPGSSTTVSYITPGSYTFVVPTGVTVLNVEVQGGAGGSGGNYMSTTTLYNGAGGSAGQKITGRLIVTPGTVLTFRVGAGGGAGNRNYMNAGAGGAGGDGYVAGAAGTTNGNGGGGGGGGATAILNGSTVIAAAQGGAGGQGAGAVGGAGGAGGGTNTAPYGTIATVGSNAVAGGSLASFWVGSIGYNSVYTSSVWPFIQGTGAYKAAFDQTLSGVAGTALFGRTISGGQEVWATLNPGYSIHSIQAQVGGAYFSQALGNGNNVYFWSGLTVSGINTSGNGGTTFYVYSGDNTSAGTNGSIVISY